MNVAWQFTARNPLLKKEPRPRRGRRPPLNGNSSSGGLAIGDMTYTSTAGTVAPTNGAIIEGNVGIGTSTPIAPLHVGAIGSMHFASGSNVT
jgi:hypothetical protein